MPAQKKEMHPEPVPIREFGLALSPSRRVQCGIMNDVTVAELFVSLQGESSYAGWPCFFVRLAGCNLHCRYCDTPAARAPGKAYAVDAIVREARKTAVALIEITGGEPLLDPGFADLVRALSADTTQRVLVETNGSQDISVLPDPVIAIVDVKCPGSGEAGSFDRANLRRLRGRDEVKFVLVGRKDYEWARAFVRQHALHEACHAVHFSPAHAALDGRTLAHWILEDRLPVRLQLQLHRILDLK